MSKDDILNKLLKIFELVVGKSHKDIKIGMKTKIIKDLGLTSVALVYMIFAIEKEFDINLTQITYNTFETVEDVVNLIYTKIH